MVRRDVELAVGVLVVVLALVIFFVGGSPQTTDVGTVAGEGGQEHSLTIDEAGFVPDSLTVDEGIVSITVTNNAQRTHGFTLLDFNIDRLIPAGQSYTFAFEATRGTYTFADTVNPALTGTLTVR